MTIRQLIEQLEDLEKDLSSDAEVKVDTFNDMGEVAEIEIDSVINYNDSALITLVF